MLRILLLVLFVTVSSFACATLCNDGYDIDCRGDYGCSCVEAMDQGEPDPGRRS